MEEPKEKDLPGKKGIGRAEMLSHLGGKSLTRKKAMQAKCYDCMGYYVDGKVDCKVPRCPLYPWMPYREGAESNTPQKVGQGNI